MTARDKRTVFSMKRHTCAQRPCLSWFCSFIFLECGSFDVRFDHKSRHASAVTFHHSNNHFQPKRTLSPRSSTKSRESFQNKVVFIEITHAQNWEQQPFRKLESPSRSTTCCSRPNRAQQVAHAVERSDVPDTTESVQGKDSAVVQTAWLCLKPQHAKRPRLSRTSRIPRILRLNWWELQARFCCTSGLLRQ